MLNTSNDTVNHSGYHRIGKKQPDVDIRISAKTTKQTKDASEDNDGAGGDA